MRSFIEYFESCIRRPFDELHEKFDRLENRNNGGNGDRRGTQTQVVPGPAPIERSETMERKQSREKKIASLMEEILREIEKESEQQEKLRAKQIERKKNEEERKEEIEKESDGQLLSCKEADLNSNDLSLFRDAEIILQEQEPCESPSPLRIKKRIGLIPSAPLITKTAFMSNSQEMEQEVFHVHMNNFSGIVDETCMISASHINHVACSKVIEDVAHISNCSFMGKYIFHYLDEYGFFQNVCHVDWDSFLVFEFVEHECCGSWIAFMRLVFDPGGNQELNSRSNFLEERGNDENHKGQLKIE